jgi:hypothetical protein
MVRNIDDAIDLAEDSGLWSVLLAPTSGAFQPGAGTVTVQMPVKPANVSAPSASPTTVKLYWGHK